jgi:heme/copper-type cytochrome/quinol oxidase subunit 2
MLSLAKKHLSYLIAIGVCVVLIAGAWVMSFRAAPNEGVPLTPVVAEPGMQTTGPNSLVSDQFYPPYSANIPKGISAPTPAQAPSSTNTERPKAPVMLTLREDASGFTPRELVVKRGSRVQIEFTAVDGRYDLVIARPIGAYVVAEQGMSTTFGFDAKIAGTYEFSCKLLCPANEPIRGNIVIID